MKSASIFTLILASSFQSFSQQGPLLSLSGGPAITSSEQKINRQGNGYSLQADGFMPLFRKGWDGVVKGGSRFAFGIQAGIDYTALKNNEPGTEVISERYQVFNGTTNFSNSTADKFSGTFSAFAGLRANMMLGEFFISPIISAGYISIKQEGRTQTGNFSANGQTLNKDLLIQGAMKESGLLVKPQLKFGYTISDCIQLYIAGALNAGPKMEYSMQTLVPNGGFRDTHTYEADQIKSGTYTKTTVETRYKTSELHLGLSAALGSRRRRRVEVLKSNKTGDPLAKVSSVGTLTSKGGGAAAASYAATGRMMSAGGSADSTPKPQLWLSKKGYDSWKAHSDMGAMRPGQPIGGIVVKGGRNPGPNSFNLTTNENGEITVNVSEPGEYKFQVTANDIAAKPGNPIGGIIVKGGKNPGPRDMLGVADNNGEITFTATEAGQYIFRLTTPEVKNNQNSKEKPKERPIRGIKDTIKTQV